MPRLTKPPAISVTKLTDIERTALSYAFFDKQFDVQAYRDMAGQTRNGIQVISGWDNATPVHEAERIERIKVAMWSLARFEIVEGYYEHASQPSRERIERTDEDGLIWCPATGWRYKITDIGRKWMLFYNARIYRCCDGCVVHDCVCRESTFCAEHGGGCHGSHD